MADPAASPDAIRLPGARSSPLATLGRRVVAAVAVIAFVGVVAFLGRRGYADAAGDEVSLLDAFYYATVSVTTTGYGDITPRTDTARLVTALVVTPARVLFLILVVGTTLEILTERSRHAIDVHRWRRRLHAHIVVVGYGTKGRSAVEGLAGRGVERGRLVVIDRGADAVAAATADGYAAIQGDAASTAVLRQAGVDRARAVIVAPDRDDTAVLVTLTARELNRDAIIVASVREEENAHLLREGGADSVITSSGAAGRLLGLATHDPAAVQVLEDLLSSGSGLDIVEREIPDSAIGTSPRELTDALVIAVVRGGEVVRFDDPRAATLQRDDRLVCLLAHPEPNRS